MKIFPRQGLPECMSSRLTTPAVPQSGQPESTGSDGKSTDSQQFEMFSPESVNSRKRTLNAQVL